MPLHELWDDRGTLPAVRGEQLGLKEIAKIARHGPFRFVIADAGMSLQWVPIEERFAFWKTAKLPSCDDLLKQVKEYFVPMIVPFLR